MRNNTVTVFILLGLTDDPQLQVLIFIFLFLTYVLSITGNLTIISCKRILFCCWVAGLFILIPPLSLGLNLEFCDSNIIDHFVCDASPLLKISCSNTWFMEQTIIICAVLTFIMTLMCVVLSYIYIIKTILRFPSAKQKKKAFSTCSSHMIVVSLTYGSCIFIYIKPSAKDSVAINKRVTVLTTSIAPMLNPFIYTLRNKQVKQAFKDSVKRIVIFSKK
uniref:G-protein coupled receptors family 1 profile domain-containing protein n=1 Tax=Ictidomys tridecemlineatus TaxID=43179 RepID=I3MN06_ICTTR